MKNENRSSAIELDGWVRRKLPRLNAELDQTPDAAKAARTEFLIDELNRLSVCVKAETELLLRSGDGETLEVLGDLGFMLASCARHRVPMDHPKLSPAIDVLHTLGGAIGHPPRDSLYTYVLSNSRDEYGRFRAFTSHAGEQAFIDLTRQALEASEHALLHLQEFQHSGCRRPGPLIEAIDRTKSYQGCFHAFNIKDRDGKRAVEPDFFYRLFRDYFPTVELRKVSWGPPTAANAAPVIIIDFVLGVATDEYRAHVAKRLRYFTPRDQFRIRQAMRTPSILDEFIDAETDDPAAIAERIATRGHSDVVKLFLDLVRRVGGAASTHGGLILEFLKKPHEAEQRELQARAAADTHAHLVDPTHGASGMSFPEVWAIREMRLNNPGVLLLQKAADLVATG